MRFAHARHYLPMAFRCDWPTCRARIGMLCTSGNSFHTGRRNKAGAAVKVLGEDVLDAVLELLMDLKMLRQADPAGPAAAQAESKIVTLLERTGSPVGS